MSKYFTDRLPELTRAVTLSSFNIDPWGSLRGVETETEQVSIDGFLVSK